MRSEINDVNTIQGIVAVGLVLAVILFAVGFANSEENKMQSEVNYNKLTPEEENVIVHKGTERPFSGKYNDHNNAGTYVCKRCDAALYKSGDKFDSQCGWPSFDDEIPGAVRHQPDTDGRRTEIICGNCGAHLGHVFEGERLTDKNVRHCVNSISLNFVPSGEPQKTDTAWFAGGCFWGVEYYMQKETGVVSTRVGYMGGNRKNPTYNDVCSGNAGHVEVVYNPKLITYEKLARLFFEIHDPTQVNRQGPDIGVQYQSAIFYSDDKQKQTAEKLIQLLTEKGLTVATQLRPSDDFWRAEDYHQDYYLNNGHQPYCHTYNKRF